MKEKLIDYFALVDVITRIEQAEKPDLEKISLFIETSENFYKHLDFNLEEGRINAYVLDEESGEWVVQQTTPELAVDMAKLAHRKFAQEQALKNMGAVYEFYKKRYQKFVQVYKPYYDYNYKLLNQVKKSLVFVRKGKKMEIETLEKDKIISDQETKIDFLAKENKKVNEALDGLQERLKKELFNMKHYTDWLRLLSDKSMFSKEKEIRIITYLLVRGESERSEMATKLRISPGEMSTTIADLRKKGVVTEKKFGRASLTSLSEGYIDNIAEKEPTKIESAIDAVAEFRRKKAIQGTEKLTELVPENKT